MAILIPETCGARTQGLARKGPPVSGGGAGTGAGGGRARAAMAGLASLFRSRQGRGQAAEFPPLAPQETFTAVGDIHGRYDLLMRLIDKIGAGQGGGRLVFLGDYIDRGEEGGRVLETLFWLQQNAPGTVCLRGNHEEMLLAFLTDPLRHGPAWQQHGGRQTLACYGVAPVHASAPEAEWLAARDSLRGRLGAELTGWLQSLPALWQSGNVAAVHAAADPARPVGAQDERDLVWGHPNFLKLPRHDGTWVIHGHTIVGEVAADDGRIGVDTGAFATGKLSAITVSQGRFETFAA